MKWLVSFIVIAVVGFGARYIVELKKENQEIARKLSDNHSRIEHLKGIVAEDERQLDKSNMEQNRRIENLNQLIVAKQKELQMLDDRILALKQNPNSAKAKQDAQADLKLSKDKLDMFQNQIHPLEQSKNNLKFESHDDQAKIEDRFRTQDNTLNYQVKGAEDALRSLENEYKSIKIVRKDPVATNEKNSKSQEIANQKNYLSDLRRQKRDLVYQHSIQKSEVSAGLNADQNQVEQQLVALKAQLKDEKARFDALEKTLKSFSNSEDGIRNQLRGLQDQKMTLQKEISELQASH